LEKISPRLPLSFFPLIMGLPLKKEEPTLQNHGKKVGSLFFGSHWGGQRHVALFPLGLGSLQIVPFLFAGGGPFPSKRRGEDRSLSSVGPPLLRSDSGSEDIPGSELSAVSFLR